MSLTIQQITELPHLGTRFLAGESGGRRLALWAHTCELPDPWKWLGTGDLLLTDGYSFPEDSAGQCAFLQQLHAANLSGLVLAQGQRAAALTAEGAAQADDLAFPVLETAYSVPFVTVARTVAESNSHESRKRLNAILRVYDVVRRGAADGPRHAGLLSRLATEIGMSLHVVDLEAMVTTLDSESAPDRLVDFISAQLSAKHRLPAFNRVDVHGRAFVVLPLGDSSSLVLAAAPRSEDVPMDLTVLQHIVAIVGLEAERRAGLALRRRVNGSQLLRQLVEGTVDGLAAEPRIGQHGLGGGPWVVAAVAAMSDLDVDLAHARLRHASIPHILFATDRGLLVLLDDAPDERFETLPRLLSRAGVPAEAAARLGVSQEMHSLGRVPDAVREARWALEAGEAQSSPVSRYGARVPMFMPPTLAHGEAVVARVLGDLIAYDETSSGSLMTTLKAYFDANRSVQACAGALSVHKQTVVYRMRRIEQVTGRDLQDLGDLTTLYLAERTWELLSADAVRPPHLGRGVAGLDVGRVS